MNSKKSFFKTVFIAIAILVAGSFSLQAQAAPMQQGIPITGTIVDNTGEALPGVSIAVRGTTTGTTTDANGRYSINVPDRDAVLVFTFIGFGTQQIAVGGMSIVNVTMYEEASVLDELVVVGYGAVRRANLTGSVDQIDSRILEDRPITSVAQALQGTMANLNITTSTATGTGGGGSPAATMSLNIRGITGIGATSSAGASAAGPLIVIDGVQGQNINTVNPNDIESISILKDAASAAIYGSNAPYGVILITTKQGQRGAKPTINYSTNLSWAAPIHMPKMVTSVEWAEILNQAQQNTNGRDFLNEEEMQRIRDYYDGKITTPTVTIPGRTGVTSWGGFDFVRSNDNVNWYDVYIKENAFSQQHNLSVSGGSQNSSYFIGLGYLTREGLLRYGGDNYDRYNVRVNLSSNITNWLTANVRWAYTKGIHDRPTRTGNANFMQEAAQKWPIIPLKNNDGRWSDLSRIDQYLYGGRNVTTNDNNVMTGELVVAPLKGWNTTFNYTYRTNNIAQVENSINVILFDAWGNPYHSPGWTADGFNEYSRGRDNLARQRTDEERHTINAFTSYEMDVNDHYIQGMVGFAQEYIHYYQMSMSSGNVTLYTTELPTFQTMYYTDNNMSVTEPSKQTLTTRGFFGRINYGYKNRYLFEFNGRYDGTSRYLEDVRWKFYPGVSAAWVVSMEDFWGETLRSYVDFFKVRGSYGSLGEQSGGYYPFYPSMGVTAATAGGTNWLFNGSRFSSLSAPGIVNPNLTWVTSTTAGFGIDAAFLKSRLTATYDWYQRMSTNVVGPPEELPAVLGVGAPNTNNSELKTTGFELTLAWRDRIQSAGIRYGIRANLANSKSEIMKYPNETNSLGNWYEGQIIGEIWGYVTDGYYTIAEQEAGIDQTIQGGTTGPGTNWTAGDIKYRDLNDDGFITRGENTVDDPGDRKIIGNSRPRYTYGVTLDAAWKNFDISLFLQGVGARDTWFGSGVGQFWGLSDSEWQANMLTIHRDRWTPDTPNGYYPKYYMSRGRATNEKNQLTQTKYLQNSAYMRLKNLQIGYTLPSELLNRVSISRARVYVSGENLLTFTKFVETIDPELAGTDRGLGYPLQRSWSVGLNLSF